MKIISLNLMGRRIASDAKQKIADFLDNENADIACFQEVTFNDQESLVDEINKLMKNPYRHVQTEMSSKMRLSDRQREDWGPNMQKIYDRDPNLFFTDGQGIVSRFAITKSEKITLTKVAPDSGGRADFSVRIAQNIDLENGVKISNVHLASNNNGYMQLNELIHKIDDDRMIIGDFNIPHKLHTIHGGSKILGMQDIKDIWSEKYQDSTEFSDYISFPEDNDALDHLLLPKNYRFISIRVVSDLSDHNAVIFNIEKISSS